MAPLPRNADAGLTDKTDQRSGPPPTPPLPPRRQHFFRHLRERFPMGGRAFNNASYPLASFQPSIS